MQQQPHNFLGLGSTGSLQQTLSMASRQQSGNKDPLVTVEEYQLKFATSSEYGKSGGNWPHNTILLYKYSSNATTKYDKIPENTFKRVNNKPKKGGYHGKHAEQIIIEEIKIIQQFLEKQSDYYEGSYKGIHSIEVISNYSPCGKCSDRLCDLKYYLEEKVNQHMMKAAEYVEEDAVQQTEEDNELIGQFRAMTTEEIHFLITFSNFYKYYDLEQEFGLIKLLNNDIKLDTFKDENWDKFFNATGLTSQIRDSKRQKRESVDEQIRQQLICKSAII